jgi:hypothetical protein
MTITKNESYVPTPEPSESPMPPEQPPVGPVGQ